MQYVSFCNGYCTWYNILQVHPCCHTWYNLLLFKGWIVFWCMCIPHAPSQWRTHGEAKSFPWTFKSLLALISFWGKYSYKGLSSKSCRIIWKMNSRLRSCVIGSEMAPKLSEREKLHPLRLCGVWNCSEEHSTRSVKSWPIISPLGGNIYSKWTNIKMGTWLGLSPEPQVSVNIDQRSIGMQIDYMVGERYHATSDSLVSLQ